jgi:MFS family permease
MRRRRGTDANRSRAALLVALGVDNLGTGMFLPLGLVFATRVVGLGLDTAGAVVAAAGLLGFAVPPVAGRLSHRFGPRRVVVLSQLVQAAGAVGYLLAGAPSPSSSLPDRSRWAPSASTAPCSSWSPTSAATTPRSGPSPW